MSICNNFTQKVALIGTPNVGKTSLFNCLTGNENLIGNWDGVTVDIATGSFNFLDKTVIIDDLPGCYSLVVSGQISKEEKLACKYINQQKDIIFVNVINLENISRDLYFTLQLLEQNYSLIIVINIHNKDAQIANDLAVKLKKLLSCQIICCNAATGLGVDQLKNAIFNQVTFTKKNKNFLEVYRHYIPDPIIKALNNPQISMGMVIRYLEGDNLTKQLFSQINFNASNLLHINKCVAINQWDIFFAKQRHEFIKKHFIDVDYVNKKSKFIDTIDSIVLHKYLGLPIFFLVIYGLFFLVTKIIDLTQIYFINVLEVNIVKCVTNVLGIFHAPKWLLIIFNNGLVLGLITLINFIPSLFIMHVGLFILENSGYIARVMFLIDKLMSILGLPGKSLISMIIGFSCNVPAILSTRSIEKSKDRIITILMTPFMSCNARLAVYSIFATAFFTSQHNSNMIFYLYIIGVLSAIVTGFLLQKTLSGARSDLIMHLPAYKIPSVVAIIRRAINRVKSFLINSGSVIIGTCTVISALKAFNLLQSNLIENSWFKSIMMFFKPMGISLENWQAVAGLFSGFFAKEAIISSLNAFYHTNGQEIHGVLHTKFGCSQAAFAYLLFILLCFPCVSVISSIAKELNTKWAIFSAIWTTTVAYMVAVIYYQIATFKQHPQYSIEILLMMVVTILCMLSIIKIMFRSAQKIKDNSIIPIILN